MKTKLTSNQLIERGKAISLAKRMPLSIFIGRANIKHNNKYSYEKVEYKNAHTHIRIICPSHGEWKQTPMDHLSGQGCPQCGNIQKGISKKKAAFEKFLIYATKFHKNKYKYDKSSFVGITIPMRIICPSHGEFFQSPDVHKRSGCVRCVRGPISIMSQAWLDSIDVSKEKREQWIVINNKKIKVDALDTETNTVYEFWGDYWHGNPLLFDGDKINTRNKKTFGILFENTQRRISLIKNAGFNLIEIWELDWLKSKNNSPPAQIIN